MQMFGGEEILGCMYNFLPTKKESICGSAFQALKPVCLISQPSVGLWYTRILVYVCILNKLDLRILCSGGYEEFYVLN
jgi:hypothetical protein